MTLPEIIADATRQLAPEYGLEYDPEPDPIREALMRAVCTRIVDRVEFLARVLDTPSEVIAALRRGL